MRMGPGECRTPDLAGSSLQIVSFSSGIRTLLISVNE
jgi:hypothetical protein